MNKYGIRFIDNKYEFMEASGYSLIDKGSLTAYVDFYKYERVNDFSPIHKNTIAIVPFNQIKYIELREKNIEA